MWMTGSGQRVFSPRHQAKTYQQASASREVNQHLPQTADGVQDGNPKVLDRHLLIRGNFQLVPVV